jgi:C-terminal processing protease CtpA/Prc
MKRSIANLGILALLAAVPVLGGPGDKCEASTQECLNQLAADLRHKGLVGVDGEWDDMAGGFRVKSYISGTNARSAGVRLGDIVVAINGVPLRDEAATKADRKNRAPGSEVSLTLLRDGKKKKMRVTLSAMTEAQVASYVGWHMLDHAMIAQAD